MKKLTALMLAAVMGLSTTGAASVMAAETVDNTDLVGEGLGKDYGLGACGFDLDAMVERLGADKVAELRIGIGVPQQVNDWQIAWAEEFRALGEEYGIEMQILSADDDPAKEVDNLKNFIAQDLDFIIHYPKNLASVAATMSETNQSIPVINAVGNGSIEVDVAIEENTPQALMAYKIADQMAEDANGEDRYVLSLDHSGDVFYLRERRDGFAEYVAEHYPNIHVVDTRLDNTEDGWLNQAKESLLTHPEINAVFATYTLPMMGGYNAAKQLAIDDISIYGIDANPATLDLLEKGEIDGLYIQFPTVHAYWSLFNALRVLSGEVFDPIQQEFPEWSPYAVYTATPESAAEARGILYPEK